MEKSSQHVEPKMKCPHCDSELSLREAITILNGTGYRRMAKVRFPDDRIGLVEAGTINPLVVEILDY